MTKEKYINIVKLNYYENFFARANASISRPNFSKILYSFITILKIVHKDMAFVTSFSEI